MIDLILVPCFQIWTVLTIKMSGEVRMTRRRAKELAEREQEDTRVKVSRYFPFNSSLLKGRINIYTAQ